MLRKMCVLSLSVVALGMFVSAAPAHDGVTHGGTVSLTSIGPIAFAPDGVLLVSDPQSATIYAVKTGDSEAAAASGPFEVADLGAKLASLLGAPIAEIPIHDMAVNPASGNVFLSVSRGLGPDAVPLLVQVDRSGNVAEFSLEKVDFSTAVLPNPADPSQGRRGDNRLESITDLELLDGRVFVAGLSNEEFASNLRSLAFPFKEVGTAEVDSGASIEIYHASHGALETRSPIRTFAHFEIADEPHLLAAYTCTPLVTIPIAALKTGEKVRGTTVAELGNQNRPIDMFVYSKDGIDSILMANSSRGVMKINAENIAEIVGIVEEVEDTAGLPYETIEDLEGVVQLDRLDEDRAILLVQKGDEDFSLRSIALP